MPPYDWTEALNSFWFVVKNDLVGGWSIMNVDKPLSQCNIQENELEIADCIDETIAHHIVRMHNVWFRFLNVNQD